ncbi:MAG TPA: CBS domain-containing protein [Miltoncostaeaceae bacterium]|jgi:CBS domain-containing protein|nr:CBS domain-containing protein [Miltoncostaeaceae bacterium]
MSGVDPADCTNEHVPHGRGDGARVGDVMVTAPKAVPADGTLGDLRELFRNPHVVTALLVDGAAFAGVVDRAALPADGPDDRSVRAFGRTDVPTVTPDAPLDDAAALLRRTGLRRLVVLDRDGRTLRGLLCLTRDRSGFCRS